MTSPSSAKNSTGCGGSPSVGVRTASSPAVATTARRAARCIVFTAALYSCEEIVRPYSRHARVTGRSSASWSGSSSWSSDFTPQI